jgi:hypothetical protein
MSIYRILNSNSINNEFKQLYELARSQRRIVYVVLTAKELTPRLQNDPLYFGEPSYTLRSVGLPVRHGVHGPWSVQFTIDEQAKIVRIIKIALLN